MTYRIVQTLLLAIFIMSGCGDINVSAPESDTALVSDTNPPDAPPQDQVEPTDNAVPVDVEDTTPEADIEDDVVPLPDVEPEDTTPPVEVARLDDFAASIGQDLGLPGVSVLAFNKSEIIARGVAGVRKFGEDEPIADSDKWHLGSCTKAMTATIIARLVDRGELSFDATMGELFFTAKIQQAFIKVTVRQLLRHEGGTYSNFSLEAPDLWASLWEAGDDDLVTTRREFAEAVLASPPQYTIGTYHYSNTGYIILGSIIETITGKPWETVIDEEVFTPLGMTSCGFGAPATPGTIDAPWGHQKKKNSDALTAIDPASPTADNPPAFGPAGTVHCNLDSWVLYLQGHLGGGPEDYLKAETWEALHTPNPPKKYALGWLVPQSDILTHMGSNNMNVVTTWLYKSDDLGLIMTTNVGPFKEVGPAFDDEIPALLNQVDQLD